MCKIVSSISRICFAGLLFIALLSEVMAQNDNSCVVLMYHHFSDKTPKSTSISPQLFEKHLRYLQSQHFNVLPLAVMLKRLAAKNLPEKCVSLTADDAYVSVHNTAYPLLKKYKMSMAVFVVTNAADKKHRVTMSWQQMRAIQGKHIAFYNHSAGHQHWLDLDAETIKSQINKAQQRLWTELQTTDKILAYPYGEADISIYNQLQNLGYIAFGQHSGGLSYDSDLQNLPRFPMTSHYAKMAEFKTKIKALAMPIKTNRIEPTLNADLTPLLVLEFKQKLSKNRQKQLNCFTQNGTKIVWLNNKTAHIRSEKPLSGRRSRYNCTLISSKKPHYHWFSTQWVNTKIKE